MACKMVRERLREAIGRRDKGMLERALQDALAAGLELGADEDVDRAAGLVKLIDQKRQLKEALSSNDLEAIRKEIGTIVKSQSLMYNMQREVQEAERYAEGLERLLRLKRSILDMDKRTMSEVRRYHSPPQAVHRVIQAALLLLGEDEATTGEWRVCQCLMNPSGPRGMNKKIMDYDVHTLHPEIVARVKQILEEHKLKEVQPVSKGSATFHVWATAMVEEFSRKNSTSAKPAYADRQRDILGRPVRQRSPLPKRKTYSSLATPRFSRQNGLHG